MLRPLANRLSRLGALAPDERHIVLASAALLPVFSLALRALGFARFRALLTCKAVTATPLSPRDIQTIGKLVNIAARNTPTQPSCLTRSLLLQWMLRRRGSDSDLRIGVRLVQGRLDAHAWLECSGVPINDEPDIASRFAAFEHSAPTA